jgi:CRISPR-associated protein Cas5d
MERNGRGVAVKVLGEYACFSRPESKVERVSYPVMTPSAARGVLEAIFWKPEFRYEVREIHVLKLGSQATVLRNEISEWQDWRGRTPLVVQEKRQQRTSLVLKNVEYVIRGELVMKGPCEEVVGGYLDQFRRRVERGQCYQRPYLGTRECAAFFEEPGPDDWGPKRNPGLELPSEQMLFEVGYVESRERRELEFWKVSAEGKRKVWGYAVPLFFEAKVERGVLRVPREEYARLYRVEGGNA